MMTLMPQAAPTRALLLTLGLLFAPAAPAEPPPALERGYIVILGGGAAPADAEAVTQGFQPPKALALPAGHPRVLESATVSGLKPGFFIAVAGVCASKKAAEEARDVLGFHTGTGVYLREVRVPAALLRDCPTLQPVTPTGGIDLSSFRTVQKGPLDSARPSLTWVIRKKKPKGDCDITDVAVEAGGALLAHKSYEARGCREPLGSHNSWYEVSLVEVAGARFVRVNARAEWHDNGSRNDQLVDFACGALTEVATLNRSHDDAVEELLPVEGKPPREQLRMRWNHKQCYSCQPDNETRVYARGQDCTYAALPAAP